MSSQEVKVLIYSINNESFATDILEVERILGYERPTIVPDVPEFIEGIINYAGDILPIMNLGKKFKYSANSKSEDKKIIVVNKESKKFGVIVDNVSEVTTVDSSIFEEAPPITEGITKRYIKGVLKRKGKIILILDMLNILSQEEEEIIFAGGEECGD